MGGALYALAGCGSRHARKKRRPTNSRKIAWVMRLPPIDPPIAEDQRWAKIYDKPSDSDGEADIKLSDFEMDLSESGR